MSGTKRPTVRESVALMEGYHSPQLDVTVRLNTNEAPEAPPAEFTRRLAEALSTVAWHRYPDRRALRLRAAIAGIEGCRAEQVFAANGSNEVLQTICLTFGGPGRRAVVFEPTYALHGHIAALAGCEVVRVDRAPDFSLDPAVAVAAIRQHRPSLVFLCSPNNPTGLLEPQATVCAVVDAAASTGTLVVVDEAYGQFAPWSALELVGEEVPLVVTRTYSKTWSMAAARLGYLVGPGWLVEELERVVLPYHLDAVTQLAGVLAAEFVTDMDRRVEAVVAERTRVAAALADLDVDVWPSAANFILFRPRRVAGRDVWQGLVDRSVLVRDCSSWPRLEGCLRVTVGTAEEDDAFLDALRQVLGAQHTADQEASA